MNLFHILNDIKNYVVKNIQKIPDTNYYQMLLTNFISKSTSFSKTTCERAL